MANYSLVIGSKFSPFTFDELLKPALMATQAHRELENQYSELATKANVWEEMANEQTDPEAYQMYKKYSDDLKAQADILATQGLTPGSRKAMLGMKDRYSKEIIPIETAYNKREELIKQQRDALLKDSTLIFDRDYGTTNLDYLMQNPNATFTPLSGEDIAKRTAVMAKEAASAVLNDPKYTSVFNGQYVQQKIQQGYDMSQIIAAAQRDPKAPKALLGIVDAIKGEVGYEGWSDNNKKKIDSYINEGLRAAIGTPKIDVMANRGYMTEIERERLELSNELTREQISQLKGEEIPGGGRVVKLGGGKFLQYDKDGNLVGGNVNQAPPTPEEEAQQEEEEKINKMLSSVQKVSDMKGTGFNPVGVVIKRNGEWVGGREGEDIEEQYRGYGVKSNLKSTANIWPGTWLSGSGDFSYNPKDSSAEATIVTNPETIPGYLEYINGVEDISNTAFGRILEQVKRARISDEEFDSNRIQIVKVKATGNRVSSDEPYDYIIYRKS